MKVFIDMDGVVADFVGGVLSFFNKQDPYEGQFGARGDEAWDIISLLDIDPSLFWEPLNYTFWRNLYKTTDATRITNIVLTHTPKENICFLTSPIRTHGCLEGKRDWAREHYPDIPILFSASNYGPPPKYMCAAADAILIDDHTPNIDRWVKAGGIGYLFPRPWNKLHELHDKNEAYDDLYKLIGAAGRVDLHRC